MSQRRTAVKLHDLVVFRGPEDEAREFAYDLILQIRDKHTLPSKAKQAYVTAAALAVLRGGADEFVPDVAFKHRHRGSTRMDRSPRPVWTVTLVDASVWTARAQLPVETGVDQRKDVAA